MIIPKFWSKKKLIITVNKKNYTVTRYGWSEFDQAEADHMANERAESALKELVSGKPTNKKENLFYHGIIRYAKEEVHSVIGENVITRNGYGALCLNTPNIFIADIDIKEEDTLFSKLVFAFLIFCFSSSFFDLNVMTFTIISILSWLCGLFISNTFYMFFLKEHHRQNQLKDLIKKIHHIIENDKNKNFHLYETPMGYRAIILNEKHDPKSSVTQELFKQLKTDKIYAMMCINQDCFRARISPKPWRVGIKARIPKLSIPRSLLTIPAREQWVKNYDKESENYCSAKFLSNFGSHIVCAEAKIVKKAHDEYSKSFSDYKTA